MHAGQLRADPERPGRLHGPLEPVSGDREPVGQDQGLDCDPQRPRIRDRAVVEYGLDLVRDLGRGLAAKQPVGCGGVDSPDRLEPRVAGRSSPKLDQLLPREVPER